MKLCFANLNVSLLREIKLVSVFMDSLIHSLKLYETYNLEFILFNALIACPL